MPPESQRNLLIVVSSNPVISPRPAEAVRVAAGVSAWKKCAVQVYLHPTAAKALAQSEVELKDEIQFRQCLPLLAESTEPSVFIPPGFQAQLAETWNTAPHAFRETSLEELGALTASSTWVMHF